MKSKFLFENKKTFYFLIILLFSISINQYYGFKGVFPIDTFLFFDSGYRLLNGELPFKDFWAVTGLTNDIIQSLIFKIFGISWNSYVFHASFINFVIAISTFYTLCKFEMNIHFSLFYSLLLATIAYPVVGTPFPDHHSTIFSIISLYCFLLHLKTNSNIYLFFLPVFLFLAFLSKQTPAAYILVIIFFSGSIYFFYNFSLNKIKHIFFGGFFILSVFFLFLLLNKIPFLNFYKQYLMYPLTIGDSRYSEFLFPLEFSRLILRFKLIHIAILPMIFLIFKNFLNNKQYYKKKDFFILISLVFTAYSLILNQLLTLNQKFVFLTIPIFLAFSHLYIEREIKKNYFVYTIIFFALATTLYYHVSYVDKRKFMDLENAKFENIKKAIKIDKKLQNLNWINPQFSGSPDDEIKILNKTIKILSEDKRNKFLITHYQFIASMLPKNTYSFNRTYDDVAYPGKRNDHFEFYKNFFIDHLINKNIEIIYIIKPLDKNVFDKLINNDCYEQKTINKILTSYLIISCDELKKQR